MTIISLNEACQRLSIDAKTLRRWLTTAGLPLVPDAQDARKKGITIQHLHQLAYQHHRRLPADALDAPSADPQPLLPPALLHLPEQLAALQHQILLLQEQVTDLSRLLHQRTADPVEPVPPPHPPSPLRAVRPRPRSKAVPRSKVHVIPQVEWDQHGRYVVVDPKHGVLSVEPDSPAWFAWVKQQDSFRFVGQAGHFSAHHEWKLPHGAWRAHRQIRGHSYNIRLALAQDLTIAVLEHAAQEMQHHAK